MSLPTMKVVESGTSAKIPAPKIHRLTVTGLSKTQVPIVTDWLSSYADVFTSVEVDEKAFTVAFTVDDSVLPSTHAIWGNTYNSALDGSQLAAYIGILAISGFQIGNGLTGPETADKPAYMVGCSARDSLSRGGSDAYVKGLKGCRLKGKTPIAKFALTRLVRMASSHKRPAAK